jgi:hypothetical protein
MARTFGLLISGFACKVYAAGMALYIGNTAFHYVTGVFAKVGSSFPA